MGIAALRLGFMANFIGFSVAIAVSVVLIRYASSRIVREALWLCGCSAIIVIFVTMAMSIEGGPTKGPSPAEWAGAVLVLFSAVTIVRTIVWLIRTRTRKFGHWPEAAAIVGVCLLAYGGSGIINSDGPEDADRYLATVGAGLTATAMVLRRGASSA
jgi:hypothetical protein